MQLPQSRLASSSLSGEGTRTHLRSQSAGGGHVSHQRFWEIDALRGIAIIMVVIYHIAWDLRAFVGWDINLYDGFWHYFQRVTASTFILLVGLSLTLSYRRVSRFQAEHRALFPQYLRRGLKIMAWGLLISGVTWLVVRENYVQFGILHFIGLSILLAYPLLPYRTLNLVLGVLFLMLGPVVASVQINSEALVWLGLQPPGYAAVDYFPLVPWFGVVLIGIFLGNWLYTDQGRRFPLIDCSRTPGVNLLGRLGQKTLFIYLVHQPILISFLVLVGLADLTPF
ncbi:MAG: DUF1624 domain-containing protein [Chloroflexi bacterium]|nr:DUF1624 domain-containing protein [Chloroflexota bacterium]